MEVKFEVIYQIYCEIINRNGKEVEIGSYVEEDGVFSAHSDIVLPKEIKIGNPISARDVDYLVEYSEKRTYEIEIAPLISRGKIMGFILTHTYTCSNPECFVEERKAYIVTERPMKFRVKHYPVIDRDYRVFTGYGERFREPRIYYTEHKTIVAPELVERVKNLFS